MATTDDVKQIILEVSQLGGTADGIDNASSLDGLNFDNNMCSELTARLNTYINSKGSNNTINSRDINTGLSVQNIIDMVSQKLAA